MFARRWPSTTYASTGVIRGEPFFVSVPTRTNWNFSISSRPRAAISGAACSSSAQVSPSAMRLYSPADALPNRRLPLGARGCPCRAAPVPRRARPGRVLPRRRRRPVGSLGAGCRAPSASLRGEVRGCRGQGRDRARRLRRRLRVDGRRGAALVAAPPLRSRRLRRARRRDRGLGRRAPEWRGGDRAGGVRPARARRRHDRRGGDRPASRRSEPRPRRRADREPLARRAERDRRPGRPDPGRGQPPVERGHVGAAGRRARRLLRLRRHGVRHPPPRLARRPRRPALSGLVERVVEARLPSRARLGETPRVDLPETRYALSGDVSIAYQVHGEGTTDLIVCPGWISNVELTWEDESATAHWRRLGEFARVIRFDKRGTGLSDRGVGIADMETRMDDIRAVLDAVGSERAFVMGASEGGPLAALFAAAYPERTAGLILWGAAPRFTRAPGFPWGPTREQYLAGVEDYSRRWGSRELAAEMLAGAGESPSDDDVDFVVKRMLRSASPGAIRQLDLMNLEIDVRDAVQAIRTPTLVMHRKGDPNVPVEAGRWFAEHIPGARLLEFEGTEHMIAGGDPESVERALREFLSSV